MTRRTLFRDAMMRLKWPLRLTRVALLCERLMLAFWPFATILLFTFAALIGGVQKGLAPVWVQTGLGLALMAALVTLVRGVLRFRIPSRQAAMDRLDTGLPGRPIAALHDTQVIGADDWGSKAVWHQHQARMAARLEGARARPPAPQLARRDPYALRLVAILAFVVTLGFGSVERVADVADLMPGNPAIAAVATSWEGWIEPPAYTGQPSLYLNDQPPGALAVPKGSRLTVRLYGTPGALRLRETLSGAASVAAEQPVHVFPVVQDGTLEILGPGGSDWAVAATADVPPQIVLDGIMSHSLDGEMQQDFIARDDYGVTEGRAGFTLDLAQVERRFGLVADPEPRDPIRVDLPMPYRGDRTLIQETLADSFIQHAWAGLPVTMTLSATDAAGQVGTTQAIAVILPARRFLDPMAQALIEQRRDLLWHLDNGQRTAQVLRAVSHRPDEVFDSEVTQLRLHSAIRRLETGVTYGLSNELRDKIALALWDIAIEIEDGNLANALARLRKAQERLQEAMRQGASPEELSELMDELREAMKDYLDQLAQRDGGDQEGQSPDRPSTEVTQQDLQEMMDRIEELMQQGRQDEAMAMLDALQDLMENLETSEGQPGEGKSPGEQAMEGLQDTLREQQGLSDEAFRDLQEQRNPSARAGEREGNTGRDGGLGRGQSHTGEGGTGEGGEQNELAERQRALQDELQRQQRGLPGVGTEEGDAARDALDQAGRAMDDAAEALEDGAMAEALDHQAEAMEALREGMRNLDDVMAQDDRRGQQGANPGQPGERQADPLGRNPRGSGAAGTDAPLEQGEDVYRRAEELTEELRRRSGEGRRSELERGYLRRLLDRF